MMELRGNTPEETSILKPGKTKTRSEHPGKRRVINDPGCVKVYSNPNGDLPSEGSSH